MKYIVAGLPVLACLLLAQPAQAMSPVMCTMQYEPVCGTTYKGAYKTFSNSCMMGAEGGTYVHAGECTETELRGETSIGTYTPPAHCTAWFDGCNSCGRDENGQSFCTLRACSEPAPGYCTAYEKDSEAPPVVTDPNPATSSVQVEVEATTTPQKPGLFVRIWRSLSSWFGMLF